MVWFQAMHACLLIHRLQSKCEGNPYGDRNLCMQVACGGVAPTAATGAVKRLACLMWVGRARTTRWGAMDLLLKARTFADCCIATAMLSLTLDSNTGRPL